MLIKSIAPWFGSKRRLAPDIVGELGTHRSYWEPFCGSMSVLLSKPPSSMETVNDLHGDLVNLARVIQHETDGPRLYRRLRRSIMSRALHGDAAEVINGSDCTQYDPERAYWYFVSTWLGRNGVAGTKSYNMGYCARYTASGAHGATRFRSAIESIPAWRRRMRHVVVESVDGIEMLQRIEDAPEAAIYCDPPYLVKGARYVYDFASDDHQRLADALSRFERARVVVSYYDHPRLVDLFPDWTIRRLKATKAMVNQGMRDRGGAVEAPEVLLTNGPSYVTANGLFAGGAA
ncbi:MAG: DNA adenine methylase [Phycisphaeraceae bacterium]